MSEERSDVCRRFLELELGVCIPSNSVSEERVSEDEGVLSLLVSSGGVKLAA
jgi:hypothetical protein